MTSSKITISLFFFLISGVFLGCREGHPHSIDATGPLDHNSIMDCVEYNHLYHIHQLSRLVRSRSGPIRSSLLTISLVNRPPHEHETDQPATSSRQYTFFNEKRDSLIDGGKAKHVQSLLLHLTRVLRVRARAGKLVSFSFGSLRMHLGAAENSEIGNWLGRVSSGQNMDQYIHSTHHRGFLPPRVGAGSDN